MPKRVATFITIALLVVSVFFIPRLEQSIYRYVQQHPASILTVLCSAAGTFYFQQRPMQRRNITHSSYYDDRDAVKLGSGLVAAMFLGALVALFRFAVLECFIRKDE